MAKFKTLKSKPLSLPQLNKRRFVLSVGDEGAILTYMDGSRVLRRLFAFAPNPQEIVPFRELLSSDTKSPVFVLLDVMDQSYVPQSLPPVSSLGLHKLIEKRLARDFAAEDIKGALPIGRSEDGRKDWHFLFISVPNIPPTSGWIEFLTGLENRVRGIYLLPIEARGFINDLHAAAFGKAGGERKPAEWQILVSHNKVGGFRQVVLRNGKLVFTRLTQPIGEAIPGVIAGNIEQEVSNTLEYLKRLAFTDGATLDIYLIVADAIKEALATGSLQKYHVYAFSPHEVAGMLGLSGAAEPGDSFGDVVIAAVFGRTLRKRL
ncbi:MAG: hypothetical protein IT567_06040, partial [Alphaproteobacteria bacterium]|nr:hypothetical protein [Alphaproteobacteria bacterium]